MTMNGAVDASLLSSLNRMLGRFKTGGGATVSDMHGIVQEGGLPGTAFVAPMSVIMLITKRCELSGWTLDSQAAGSCTISIQHAPFSIPRAYHDLIGDPSLAPALVSATTAGSDNVSEWVGPMVLD